MSTTVREAFEVGDLDAAAVLEAARGQRTRATPTRVPQAPASPPTGPTCTPPPPTPESRPPAARLWTCCWRTSRSAVTAPRGGGVHPRSRSRSRSVSHPSAAGQLIGDALDLRHRHPHAMDNASSGSRYRPGRPAASPNRPTASPRPAPAGSTSSSPTRTGCGPVIVDRLVAHAIAKFDPESPRGPGGRRHSRLGRHPDPPGGHRLRRHLPPRSPRRHPHPESVLRPDLRPRPPALPRRRHRPPRRPQDQGHRHHHRPRHRPAHDRPAKPKVKVYVRVDADDLDIDATGGSALAAGEIEKLGAATLTKIRDWVGHHQVVIQPVLNMQRGDAVDVHDPPAWMRELVMLRDGHCIFPRCTIDARSCDLDHTIPYQPDGPPGQTRPDNLACLCRRHHRAKTSGLWRYTRTPEGRLPLARTPRHDLPRHPPRQPLRLAGNVRHRRRGTSRLGARSAAMTTRACPRARCLAGKST